jgi:hypothetical protein
MAHALPDRSSSHAGRFPEALDMMLNSKASIPSAVALLLIVLALFAYEVRGYLDAECYDAMHAAALDRETADLFDDAGAALVGLRKGSGTVAKWNNADFQDQLKEAQSIVADGRHALKEHNAFGALGSIVDLEKAIAAAKALATNRVNFIVSHQDPADYDTFEKYRLEGKNLVGVVKALVSMLEAVDSRTKELPRACNW